MADAKVTALAEDTAPDSSNILYTVDDPGGSPLSRKATIANVVGSYAAQMELIDDTTLGAASKFDVSSIPATYDDLLILLMLRSDVASTGDDAAVFFNNDTTASNYHKSRHYYIAGSHTVTTSADTEFAILGDSSPASAFGFYRMYIPDYANTNYEKACYLEAAGWHRDTNLESIQTATIVWDGFASAINRIEVQPDGFSTDKFVANSRMRLIGITYP